MLSREANSGGTRVVGIEYSNGTYSFDDLEEGDYWISAYGLVGGPAPGFYSSDTIINFYAEAPAYDSTPEIRDTLRTSEAVQTEWNSVSPLKFWGYDTEFDDCFVSSYGIDWISQTGSIGLTATEALCLAGMTSLYRDDFDDDGFADLIGVRSRYDIRQSDEIFVFRGGQNHPEDWEYVDLGSEFGRSRSLIVDDIDGDGLTEIITSSYMPSLGVGHRVILFDRVGSSGAWTSRILSDRNCTINCGDLDADGYVDLVMRMSQFSSTIVDGRLLTEDSDSLAAYYPDRTLKYNVQLQPSSGIYVDIIGTERPELIDGYAIYGQNAQQGVEECSGSRRLSFDGHFTLPVDTADVNQDGRLDLFCGGQDYKVRYYLNTSDSPSEWGWYQIVPITGNSADICVSEDIDCDGDADMLVCGRGGICWLENIDGFGTEWNEQDIDSSCYDIDFPFMIQCDSDPEMEIAGLVYYSEADAPHETRIWGFDPELRRGVLYSSLMVFEGSPENQQIDWTMDRGSQGSVEFRIRTGSSPFSLGEWSEPITSPSDISHLLRDGEYFYQYMVILESTPWRAGPVLKEVRFTYQFRYTLIGHPWRACCFNAWASACSEHGLI